MAAGAPALAPSSVATLSRRTGCNMHLIQKGRHGRVYRCTGSASPFAAKIFDEDVSSAMVEVRAYRRVGAHPHILSYYGSAVAKQRACIALELAHGCLIDIILDGAYSDPGRRAVLAPTVMQHVGCAIAHMHRLGVAHRDIKPDNILYLDDATGRRFVLGDLGSATAGALDPHNLTDAQGTREFAAPEVMQLNEAYDGFMADSWSFGVLLFCVARGTFLFCVAHESDAHFAEVAATTGDDGCVLTTVLPAEPLVPHAVHEAATKLLRMAPRKRGVLADMFRDPAP